MAAPPARAELKVPAATSVANGEIRSGHVNWAFRHEVEDAQLGAGFQGDDDTQPPQEGDVEQGRLRRSDTHSIVLDMSTTSFVDTVTVKTLKNVGVPFSADVPPQSSCSEGGPVRFTP